MGLHPGALVGSNVRLIRPLSRGGMGSVWRAQHLTLHTEVAVKFVADALIGDANFLARFSREAVAGARIKSPHVVQIYDHGITADGQPYIVLELLEGEDLRVRLAREHRLSVGDTIKIVAQAARGLSRAHAAEIVHRDIKPGNIFLQEQDGDLFVKLLDFGIAKRIGDVEQAVTLTGQIIGTPHYVSPEQIQRPRDADPQNDLWSLAVVAYKCLTGEMPFEGESVGAVAIAIDKAQFTPVTTHVPSLPAKLDAFFARAFSRAPSARFASARELAAAFEATSRDEPIPSVLPESSGPSAPAPKPLPDLEASLDDAATAVHTPNPAARPPSAAAAAPSSKTATLESASSEGASPESASPETPSRSPAPLTAGGEPTLSQGTVTHIELTHPRRTRLYGALIATVAIGGAITVGLLSRSNDPSPTASPDTSAAPDTSSPPPGLPPSGLPASASASPDPATTTLAPGTTTASPDPAGAPTASASASTLAKPSTARTASPAATGSGGKKKKDRGF